MKTLKEKIAVMQAALDGVEIEFIDIHDEDDNWDTVRNPAGDYKYYKWHLFDYRVKPEPLEFWVNVYSDRADGLHDRKEMAMACCKDNLIKTIKVREVLE